MVRNPLVNRLDV